MVRHTSTDMKTATLLAAASVVCLACVTSHAQSEDDKFVDGKPLENIIVDRRVAIRLRAEIRFTEDEDDLIDDDPGYQRYPSEIYEGQVRLFHENGSTYSGSYSAWSNPQDLDTTRWGIGGQWPISKTARFVAKYRESDTKDSGKKDYYYAGLSMSFDNGLYGYSQYRYSSEDNDEVTTNGVAVTNQNDGVDHQLSQYASWKCSQRVRIGAQAAISQRDGEEKVGPWYVRLFGSTYLVQDYLSLRLEARHYEALSDLDYLEYKVYLYERIGKRNMLRLGYRNYSDSEDHDSDAFGIKLKRYFSSRFSAHGGYRKYQHSEGADFDTFFAGFGYLF